MKVTIVDYGLGNIFSVTRAFLHIGCEVEIATTPLHVEKADFLVLPGVGAFQKGMQELNKLHLVETIRVHAHHKPLLGICLGMQLLFDSSEENGFTEGLGLIPGKVVKISSDESPIKTPHIGWGKLNIHDKTNQFDVIFRTLNGRYAYFVHSYHPLPRPEHLIATTAYRACTINAIVKKDNIVGCQFHPEKSGHQLLQFLEKLTRHYLLYPAEADNLSDII